MKCPNCGHSEDRVLDTRVQKEGDIRRRRECMHCKVRFSTLETVLAHFPHVAKKDGRREPFHKEKLRRGIQIACKKRPVSIAQIEGIVSKISKTVQNQGERELESTEIGQHVVEELRQLDHVAYVRFASVYRTFEDIGEFVDSLKTEANSEKPNERNS